jgi:hypothetical protein
MLESIEQRAESRGWKSDVRGQRSDFREQNVRMLEVRGSTWESQDF